MVGVCNVLLSIFCFVSYTGNSNNLSSAMQAMEQVGNLSPKLQALGKYKWFGQT